MIGVCGCVCGPPPDGICQACGAAGPYYRPPAYPTYPVYSPNPPYERGGYTFTPNPLSADDIRKIVREEIERAGLGKRDE